MSRYVQDCGTRTFSSAYPGHVIEITVMRGGGIRTECTCGWWQDVEDWEMSRACGLAQTHNRSVKRQLVALKSTQTQGMLI